MNRDEVILSIKAYCWVERPAHGPTARGVDWSWTESREIRFTELMRLAEHALH